MTRSDNKLIVRKYIEEILNTGNPENITDFISGDDCEVFNNVKYRISAKPAFTL